jgi:tetratricopeptide (TPR) repeat protein
MNKQHWTLIACSALLFAGLYFGLDNRNKQQKEISTSRAIQGEVTTLSNLLEEAKNHLSAPQATLLASLEQASQSASTPEARVEALKSLSGFWYQAGQQPVAGGYADSVAVITNTAEAWSVAGGTYFNALIAAADMPTLRKYCGSKAVKAFESAISLAPDKVEHRVNLALVYAENPPEDNPMQAVLMLRDLEAKYPNAPSVYNALGRLAIKTGQWERAIERLEKAYSLAPDNPNTPCLLAKAYQEAGKTAQAQRFVALCKQ